MARGKAFLARPAMYRTERRADVALVDVAQLETDDGALVTVRGPSPLSSLVGRYRTATKRVFDSPSRDDVRETLRRLARMSRREAATRWRKLDWAVKVEIDRAALLLFRQQQHGQDAMHAKGIEYCRRGPENLPDVAALALRTAERRQAGRPPVNWLAVEFARELAIYWRRTEDRMPTVNNCAPSAFQVWAKSLFRLAGFPTGDLVTTLKAGRKAAEQSGK